MQESWRTQGQLKVEGLDTHCRVTSVNLCQMAEVTGYQSPLPFYFIQATSLLVDSTRIWGGSSFLVFWPICQSSLDTPRALLICLMVLVQIHILQSSQSIPCHLDSRTHLLKPCLVAKYNSKLIIMPNTMEPSCMQMETH